MKKIYFAFFILLITLGSAQAEDILYIADDTNLAVRKTASSYGEVIKVLPTGTSVTDIGEPKNGFTKIRLNDGSEGYIKTKYTKKEPPKYDAQDVAGETIATLQKQIGTLKEELKKTTDAITPGTPLAKSLEAELEQQKNELKELKSADVGRLKKERDQYKEDFVTSEQALSTSRQELEQLKRDYETLEKTSSQDGLIYGGALVIIGLFLGFILPKISWRRRSSWDSY